MNVKSNFFILTAVSFFSLMDAQTSLNKKSAENWIQQNSKQLGILQDSKFEVKKFKSGNTGETYRFQQELGGVPVYQSEIVVHYNKSNKLTYTNTESLKSIEKIDTVPAISEQQAFDTAYQASKSSGEITFKENKLYVYNTEENKTKLVYRVVIRSFDNPGSWETLVDAKTGEVISIKEISHHYSHNDGRKKKKNKDSEPQKLVKATGTGYIYDPDPLSVAKVAYGGDYIDNNDATNASLDAARKLVTIPELEFADGLYKLKGKYAEIRDIEAPTTGLFTQSTSDFLFNRNDQGFEAVNAYWHLDNSLRYINEILGIECVSLYNNGILLFDPHGWNGADNSSYGSGRLSFGEGCVDDAEDADVILHELGHGIHDWITNGSLSQVQGLSEGCGDYWAQSYSRSLNQWQPSDAAYQWVFSWDGHNACWAGRTTAYTGAYPPTSSSIHTNGQIWATSLMRIYNRIGKEKTDRAFLEGLALTTSSTNQQNAARAVRQAALDMIGEFGFTCNDIAIMTEEFTATGYVMPAYTCADLAVTDIKKASITLFPNPANDKINVIISSGKKENVEIFSIDGRKVLDISVSKDQNEINVSQLTKGIYILKVKGTDLAQKFIKN